MLLRYPLDQVNPYLFHKQNLAMPAEGQRMADLIAQVGSPRGAPPATPYLSLWARQADFQAADLDAALYEQRDLVRVPAMHSRLHLVRTADWPAYHALLAPLWSKDLTDLAVRPDGEASNQPETGLPPGLRLTVDDTIRRLLEVLGTRGPSTIDELADLLPELERRVYHDPDLPDLGYSRLGTRLLPALCANGTLVRARPRGGWRSESFTYAALSNWLPTPLDMGIGRDEALRQVVLGYLRAFGPATVGDLLHWLGGFTRRQVVKALLELGPDVARVQIAELPGEYLLLADEIEPLADFTPGDRAAALLPPHDHYLAAYLDTSRFLDPIQEERVYDRVGEATGTIWLDGLIVGIWWPQWRDERLILRLFEAIDPEDLALVGETARRLAEFLDFNAFDLDISTEDDEGEPTGPLMYADPTAETPDIIIVPQGD